MTYHTSEDGTPDVVRMGEEVAFDGGELLGVYESREDQTLVLLLQRGAEVHLVFRGSCTGRNVLTDIDYHPAEEGLLAAFEVESGLKLPKGVVLHRGFLQAWRSVRAEVMRGLDDHFAKAPSLLPSKKLSLHVTGHSMGGAMAMLASLEVAHRYRGKRRPFLSRLKLHRTITFGAPRLGDAAFALFYRRRLSSASSHVALQAASDAVPHLPFAAWGYRHPHGIVKISADQVTRVVGDPGDEPDLLRPLDGKAVNWAVTHMIPCYLEHLAALSARSLA